MLKRVLFTCVLAFPLAATSAEAGKVFASGAALASNPSQVSCFANNAGTKEIAEIVVEIHVVNAPSAVATETCTQVGANAGCGIFHNIIGSGMFYCSVKGATKDVRARFCVNGDRCEVLR